MEEPIEKLLELKDYIDYKTKEEIFHENYKRKFRKYRER